MACVLTLSVQPVKLAADTLPQPKDYTKSDLIQLVYTKASEFHVKPQTMINVINCEDTTWDPTKQSDIVRGGVREESYGLSQINLPSHPDITKSQSQEPEFAIEFMAKEMAAGHANKWSCYRKLYN